LPRRLIPRTSNAGPCPKSDRRRGGRREEPIPHPAFVDVTITARSTCCNGRRRTELNGGYRTSRAGTTTHAAAAGPVTGEGPADTILSTVASPRRPRSGEFAGPCELGATDGTELSPRPLLRLDRGMAENLRFSPCLLGTSAHKALSKRGFRDGIRAWRTILSVPRSDPICYGTAIDGGPT
jgi:hypothetical protein